MRGLSTGDETDIELLSRRVRDIFRSEGGGERSQSGVSNAGRNWRKMVWASLSALSIEGRTLPLLGEDMVEAALPSHIRSALRISLGDEKALRIDPEFLLVRFNRDVRASTLGEVCTWIEEDSSCIEGITVIWASTNFNDNIQRPMLWSWVGGMQSRGKTPDTKYAWVTVPTNRPGGYGPGNTTLVRASTFSAGGYWGIGREDALGMGSVFDLVGDWRENLRKRHASGSRSEFLRAAFPDQ